MNKIVLFFTLAVTNACKWVSDGWAWTDLSALGFTNWAQGEPNGDGHAGTREDCVEMYKDGKWNDNSCLEKRGFVCKRHQREIHVLIKLLEPSRNPLATQNRTHQDIFSFPLQIIPQELMKKPVLPFLQPFVSRFFFFF